MNRKKRFWALFGFGAIGIAFLPIQIVPMLRSTPIEMPPGVPPPPFLALVLGSLLNPLILLALGVFAGLRCTPHFGLRSLVDDRARDGTAIWPRLAPAVPLAVGLGLAAGAATMLLDLGFAPFMGPLWAAVESRMKSGGGGPGTLNGLIVGLAYGGITEELMLRWGFMSFVAWIIWRASGKSAEGLSSAQMRAAIVIAAIVFGLGHLPALIALVPPTAAITVRTVVLNAIAGVVFGWLFWRRSLEAAMVAHASAHVAINTLALALR